MTRRRDPARPSPWRRRILLGTLLAAGVVVCGRAVQVQAVQGRTWRALAEAQHRSDQEIVAPRGRVLDRDGTPLAVSRERYRVNVAPGELSDRDQVVRLLEDVLGLSRAQARRATDPGRRWVVVPGLYPPAVREALAGVRGVHLERELQRYHPHGDLARGVLGVVIDDEGRGGIEQAFDDVLRGVPGREIFARDHTGREIPGERVVVARPQPGGDVVLTLDMDLQEIARQALEEAIAASEARGGDVVISDPSTGEILALVSIREGRTAALSAINTPYEPGSTLKPFTVAGLMKHGLISLHDTVDVGDGTWRVAGRTLHDVHAEGRMSVADALRVSSNVGIAKAAARMPPGWQYENLRDFGFGVPTGIEIPGEVPGTLRRPRDWSAQSPASLAIGYEVAVTPLQMVMAYGALANGGLLMKPRLVREVHRPDGRVERYGEEVVRRVISPRIARQIARVLVDVVEDGTGTSARLGSFRVAGKSGTTRMYTPGGGYERGAYWSSFAGFFPAEDPQLVVFVKLERPKGAYYGGAVAAPVTRATMEAALAARSVPLNRRALVRTVQAPPAVSPRAVARFASQPVDPPPPPLEAAGYGSGAEATWVPLPDVAGLAPRIAVRQLHARGLRVEWTGDGEVVGTEPPAGERVSAGDTVRLILRRAGDG